MDAKQVAETILEQLGGNRFRTMTGASSFASGVFANKQPGVSFRLPRCKSGITSCIITLSPEDLYEIRFGKMVQFDYRVVAHHEGISVENLRETFEKATGLYVSL